MGTPFRILCLVLFLFLNFPLTAQSEDDGGAPVPIDLSITDSVVKVFVTTNKMDYYRPWQSEGIMAAVGSGVIVEGNRILTNAHIVSDHTFIQVKKDTDPKKYTAELVAIGNDCDLALLTVKEPGFFDGIEPMPFGDLPKQQESVVVIGYPQGGEKISITEGVVSRIEIMSYVQSSRQLLTVQIDAAINPGNSGGPVVRRGKLVGIAMQILQSSQNIGYMIPIPIIEHFFKDLEDGNYDGFPMLGIDFKGTENGALREYYGIKEEKGGVLVSRVLPYSPAYGRILEGDIILEINGVPIGEDGTFIFRGTERLSLVHLVTKEYIGDDVSLKIMRDKKVSKLDIHLKPFVMTIPPPQYFERPPYFIFGGMVYTVLSTDLVHSWGNLWWEKAPPDLVYYAVGAGNLNQEERKQIVVLLSVLPDDINIGYHGIRNEIVRSVNGLEIKSFKDFVLKVNEVKNNEPYTIVTTESNRQVILNNDHIDEVDEKIVGRNNIPDRYSRNVAEWIDQVQ